MITLKTLKALNPGKSSLDTLLTGYPQATNDTTITIEMVVKSNGIADAFWLLEKLNPPWLKRFALAFAIWCAESVLPLFEAKFPNDKRPRKAIEAAKAYLENPTSGNADRAHAAADDAARAAHAAHAAAHAPPYAAYAAANAAYAAANAAYAAYADANAAANAANAAGAAAARANAAARKKQKEVFIELLGKYKEAA